MIIKVTKISSLEKIEELGFVEIYQVANHLNMKYETAERRMFRYSKSGLVESMGIERRKYCLSSKGQDKLDYLRKSKERSSTRRDGLYTSD